MYRIIWFDIATRQQHTTPWIDSRSQAVLAFHRIAESGNAYSVRIEHAYREVE